MICIHQLKNSALLSGRGFTLVELLVAIAIFALVSTGVWSSFQSQNTIYNAQEQVAKIQQNTRAAIFVMEKDIRMAGYDPDGKGYGISEIKNNSIRFTRDDGAGGNTPVFIELDGTDLERNDSALAENIYNSGGVTGFGLAYAFDADGDGRLDMSPNGHIIWAIDSDNDNDLDLWLDTDDSGEIEAADDSDNDGVIEGVALGVDIPPADIKAVRIWVLGQAEKMDRTYRDNNTYIVGRNVIQPDDRVRRRILTSIVKCRNL